MKKTVYINPSYKELEKILSQIPGNYRWMGKTIHCGRNEVKLFNIQGKTIAIKSYKKITWINRIVYALIRKSKSQRAYENSMRIIQQGISSPEPIAHISVYRNCCLVKDFYVSLYTNYRPIGAILSLPISESEFALRSFANFSYHLHVMGIYHGDYTLNNVLYSYNGFRYDFSLIDNNRIRFGRYNPKRGLRNLQRLFLPVENIGIISAEYALRSNINALKTIVGIAFYRLQYLGRTSMKKRFKSLIRKLNVKTIITAPIK
ncbi:MAG: hypothetical protein AB7S48_01985 [Bacteroidales bacterium]